MPMAQLLSKQSWRGMKQWFGDHSTLIKRTLSIGFFLLVIYVLAHYAGEVEWAKVFTTLREMPLTALITGLTLAILCYSAYAAYDLFGRHLLRLRTSKLATWIAAWISFACNTNLGALVGSIAFRYRLYSRLGVGSANVTRILAFSVTSNWLGYCLLAGVLFISGRVEPPESWFIGKLALQLLGAAFVTLVGFYLYLCFFAKQREYTMRGHTIALPPGKIALLQFGLAGIHWTLMVATLYQFMPEQLAFTTVYAVLLVSCVAGAISHIPGGLGVVEAVFVALLAGGEVSRYQLIAGIFAYRCVFYLAPLLLSLPVYIAFEGYYRKRTE